jgi:hypothetical protein
MWHIWDARNKVREGEGTLHPASLTIGTNCYADGQYLSRRLFIGAVGIGPCFGRGRNLAVGVDYSGDLTRRQSRRVRYFHFLIVFSVLQKIKENGKKFKK